MNDRYVVCDEARQQLVYYGNDPKRTLVELHLTEEPKGVLCSVPTVVGTTLTIRDASPLLLFTGTISLKNAHIEVMDKPVKGAPTKFTFKLITADRVSYLSVKCVELPVREGACTTYAVTQTRAGPSKPWQRGKSSSSGQSSPTQAQSLSVAGRCSPVNEVRSRPPFIPPPRGYCTGNGYS